MSLFLISALFGFADYQQSLTGIIEEGSDGLILGLMYLACRRNLAPMSPTESAAALCIRANRLAGDGLLPTTLARGARKQIVLRLAQTLVLGYARASSL